MSAECLPTPIHFASRNFFILALICAAGLGGAGRVLAADTVNRIVAVVNDEVVTEGDVAAYLQALRGQGELPAPPPGRTETVREMVLQRLIEQRLILQEAKRSGVQVDVDELLERFDALKSQFDSPEEFEQSLLEAGLSAGALKQQLRNQLLVQRVIDAKVRSTISVSPQEVARELAVHPEEAKPGDRFRVAHILIRVTDTRSEPQARELIQRLHDQLARGADFAAVAKQYSEDPHREEGGNMGWVAPGELLPELDAALTSLKPGELSEPIRTRLGWHLVRVEERRDPSSLSVTEANRAVYQRLYQRKFQEAFVKWLEGLKRKAYIEILELKG